MPEVCVVLPCHDAADTVGLQLEALAGQLDAPTFEVLVVDNRSQDELVEVVESWTQRLPGLRLITAPDRAGAGYARNVGVASTNALKLLFCDADDLIARDWVRAGAHALDLVGVACGQDITLESRQMTSVERVWIDHLDGLPRTGLARATQPAAYPVLLGGNLAIRRSIYLELDGYDETFVLGNEDNDLAVRAQRAGHLIHRTADMYLAVRSRASLRSTFRRARMYGRGHIELVARHDLWQASPHLRRSGGRSELPRALAAAARMLTRPAPSRDWGAIATRCGTGLGFWEGTLALWRDRIRK